MNAVNQGLVAHRLIFSCRATTNIALPDFAGAAVRGALFAALRQQVCVLHGAGQRDGEEWSSGCPACALFAPVDAGALRGRDVVRLFTIEPPLESSGLHESGWVFSFGLTLFGPAVALYPYLAVAVQSMGKIGFGRRTQAPGQFVVLECWADDPLGGRRMRIMDAHTTALASPCLPIDDQIVAYRARAVAPLNGDPQASSRIALTFLTPTRLISEGRLTATPQFPVVIRRAFRRLCDLAASANVAQPTVDFTALTANAGSIRLVQSNMRWIDLSSFSGRRGVATPIGGLVGEAVYEGDLRSFMHWLLWSSITHIGKDATKGNGVCTVVPI